MRPRWKEPYLVTGILNEVDAILKADGRSRKTLIVHFSKLKKCFGKPFIAPMNYQDQSIEESNLIDETEIEQSPASNSLTEKHQMERARESEEDSSSDERQTQGRAQKEQPSQRNEEPDGGACSKRGPYQTRRYQKAQPTRPPQDQVGRIEEDDHLNVEGYASDATVNQIFKHGRTSNEMPAIKSSQTITSSKSPKSILKSKNKP